MHGQTAEQVIWDWHEVIGSKGFFSCHFLSAGMTLINFFILEKDVGNRLEIPEDSAVDRLRKAFGVKDFNARQAHFFGLRQAKTHGHLA